MAVHHDNDHEHVSGPVRESTYVREDRGSSTGPLVALIIGLIVLALIAWAIFGSGLFNGGAGTAGTGTGTGGTRIENNINPGGTGSGPANEPVGPAGRGDAGDIGAGQNTLPGGGGGSSSAGR